MVPVLLTQLFVIFYNLERATVVVFLDLKIISVMLGVQLLISVKMGVDVT